MVLQGNSWRNILLLIRLIGNKSVTWLGIKGALEGQFLKSGSVIYGEKNTSKTCGKISVNVKLWRLWISHHLKCIKPSEFHQKSLCARDKAENQYWTSMIFWPSGMILSRKSLHGLGNTSRNHRLWRQFTVPSTNAGSSSIMQRSCMRTWSRNTTSFSGPTLI